MKSFLITLLVVLSSVVFAGDLRSLKLKIDGLDCAGCAKGLAATLERVEGIQGAELKFEESILRLDYDPDLVRVADIVERIKDLGFDAVLDDIKEKNSDN